MNLPVMSDSELERLYVNCVDAIVNDKPTKERAQSLIVGINAVWEARLSAPKAAAYKAESPEKGVLKTIGYQVGNDGVAAIKRQSLLDFAMTGQLPFVGSPAHVLEWGEPISPKRYRKLHRVLTVFRSGEPAVIGQRRWKTGPEIWNISSGLGKADAEAKSFKVGNLSFG